MLFATLRNTRPRRCLQTTQYKSARIYGRHPRLITNCRIIGVQNDPQAERSRMVYSDYNFAYSPKIAVITSSHSANVDTHPAKRVFLTIFIGE
ncbi:MAG: hypothetical protein GY820_32020 [Gammaproteobacteria bacterium]|nr:hypothetical protein [Gammaproteobacteria bacterium]